MHLDDLIQDFCQDLKVIACEEILNALGLQRPQAPKLKTPKARAPKMAPSKTVYMPHVSSEIQAEVQGALLPDLGLTSHEIADAIKRGETTVRTALKHLVQSGKVRTETKGRAIFFFQVTS
jgi:hypothetical protein